MKKSEIIYEFKRMYLRNEPLSQIDLMRNHKEIHDLILLRWDSWHKFIKEVGLLDRHLKERSRYFLYQTMMLRVGRFNEEVLLHKNIEPEMKEKIVNNFGSVRRLIKDIIEDWGPKKVLYDVHTYLITGGTPNRLKNKKPMLYKRLLEFYGDENSFYEEYQKLFWLNPLEEIPDEEGEQLVEDEDLSMLSLIVKLGYMSEAEADNVRLAKEMSELDILTFVKKLPYDITESELTQTNQKMWWAIKQNYGSLENARMKACIAER